MKREAPGDIHTKSTKRAYDGSNSLPIEIWCVIFQYVPEPYYPMVRQTCRTFRSLHLKHTSSKITLTSLIKEGTPLSTLQWVYEQGCPWDEMTCARAAKEGHLDVLKWLREKGCPWDARTCSGAAKGGHFDVLKWARENGCPE